MGTQRNQSVDIHLLGPHCRLTSILLAAALVIPTFTLDSLLCFYCPLQQKSKSCLNTTSQCLPDQRCSSSRGHFGPVHILSAQGCVDSELCGSHEIISYRGVKYNVSHTCCCKDKCNVLTKANGSLKKLLGMIPDKTDYTNITHIPDGLWDSCANYTSPNSPILSTSAS